MFGSIAASIGGSLLSGVIGGVGSKKAGEESAAGYAAGMEAVRSIIEPAAKRTESAAKGTFRRIEAELRPWADAGFEAFTALNEMRPELTTPFSEEAFRADPGYQFRVSEGNRALTNYLSSQGMRESGEALDAVMQRNQGYADQAYGDAFNRYWSENTNRFNMMNTLVGYGERATGGINTAQQRLGDVRVNTRMGAANTLANYLFRGNVGAGNAQAQGTEGFYQGIGSGVAGATQNYMTGQLMTQPIQPAMPIPQVPPQMQPYNYFAGGAIPGRGVL